MEEGDQGPAVGLGEGEEFEDIRHRRPVLDKLRSYTGYEPKWSLEQTIDDLLEDERRRLAAASSGSRKGGLG